MASYTQNLNLIKIDGTDAPPDITVLNQNWNILDQTIENKMNKHLLQYDGDIKENVFRLTFPVLYNILLNSPDFVILVNDGEALHPNIVNNEEIVFVSVDPDNTGLMGRKITMTNDGFSTVTLKDVNTVPSTRKINNKELSNNINLNATDVGAVPTTGGTMTGALKLNAGTAEINASTTQLNLSTKNSASANVPRRDLVIRNSRNLDLEDAVALFDYKTNSTTEYTIFGKHNMGNIVNNPNNISTYTHLNQLGLSDSDFSSTDFSANFTKILAAMPTHARLVCTTGTNFKNALVAKILADTGFSHDNSATYVINVTKTGSGVYQVASLRANEMYASYVGREYSVFRYISSNGVATDTRVIFTSSTDGGFASRLKRSYNTLAQIGLSDASFAGKTLNEAIDILYNAMSTTCELTMSVESGTLPNLFNIFRTAINSVGFGIGGSLVANGQVGVHIVTSASKYRTHVLELFPDANAYGTGNRVGMKALFEYSTNTGLTVSPLIIDYDPNGFVTNNTLASKVQSLMESGDISMLMSPVSIKNYTGSGTRSAEGKGKIYLGCITTASYSDIVIDGKVMSSGAIEMYYGSVEIDFTTSFSIRCNSSNCSVTAIFY